MSSKRHYFRMAYGIEEVESVEYIHDDEIDASLATSEGDADATLNDINVTSDTADTLSNDLETVEVIEETVNNPEGIDSQTALVVQEAIESIYRRHGLSRYRPYKYSQEDFDIKGSAAKIGKNIKENVNDLKGKINDGLSVVTNRCKNLFDGFIGKKSKVVKLVEAKSKQLKNALSSGGEWVGDKADNVINFFKGKKGKGGKSISPGKFIDGLSSYLSNTVSGFKANLSQSFKKLGGTLNKEYAKVRKGQDMYFDSVSNIFKSASSVAVGAKDELLAAIDGANKIMKQAMNAISDFSKSTFDAIKEVGNKAKGSNIGGDIKGAISGTGNFIKSTATSACNSLNEIIDMCSNFIKNASAKAKSFVTSK